MLALDVVIGYDLVIPPTVFGEAADDDGNPLYDVRICGLDRSPVRVLAGYTIVPDHGAEILAESDTVIIPGTRLPGRAGTARCRPTCATRWPRSRRTHG